MEKTSVPQEKLYLETWVDAMQPQGHVLEVGFEKGHAAAHIQTYYPKSHTIIEPSPDKAKRARSWAQDFPTVTVMEKPWQNALPSLHVYDTIFFYNTSSEIEATIQKHKAAGHLALQSGEQLLSSIKQKLPALTKIRYSNSEIHELYEQTGQFHLKNFSYFLQELCAGGQISQKQYEEITQKYGVERIELCIPAIKPRDDEIVFLQAALNGLMKKGSRFSSFSQTAISKFQNPYFFEHIITNPDLDFQEKWISPPLPAESPPCEEALVTIIEKLG